VIENSAINASPLIYLSRANLLDLLKIISDEIIIPQPVADEILRRGTNDITARAIRQNDWLKIVPPPAIPPEIISWSLGLGESSVLAFTLKNDKTEAIIDDLAARRCAAALQIPVRGTLGIVLIAKKRGEISAARPLLEKLRQNGMYLSDKVLNQALDLIGE
jgi:predicted nucleic acid-binding protein